jgi:hypothetical protein
MQERIAGKALMAQIPDFTYRFLSQETLHQIIKRRGASGKKPEEKHSLVFTRMPLDGQSRREYPLRLAHGAS